ncbi:MAG: glutamate 5-kinase, partial [Mucinivorans sp.]
MNRRVAIKIGSNVLTRADGSINITRMSALVDEVVALRGEQYEVV